MWTKTIKDVADQLCPLLIKDYDVALLVANYYVSLRVEDSVHISRDYHCQRYLFDDGINITCYKEKYLDPSIDLNDWRRASLPWGKILTYSNHIISNKHRELNGIFRYLHSRRGFHQHYWNSWRSVASIPWRDQNEIISLKDKLNDLKKLKPHIISSPQFYSFDWLSDSETYL